MKIDRSRGCFSNPKNYRVEDRKFESIGGKRRNKLLLGVTKERCILYVWLFVFQSQVCESSQSAKKKKRDLARKLANTSGEPVGFD